MLKYFLHKLLFAATWFAAGAPALTDAGAGAADGGSDAGTGGAAALDTGEAAETAGEDVELLEDSALDAPAEQPPSQLQIQEEPELAEFKGSVAARLKLLTKQAPELTQIFQKYPKVQETVAAIFRREAALRDVFPTVAEARQMRETFPNGLADVQALQSDVQELESLDKDFYTKDAQGNYSGHTQLLNNMFQDDREAAVALFKTLPKEWARLDRDSYNETFGRIVGATLQARGWPEYLTEIRDAAKAAEQRDLASHLDKLLRDMQTFGAEKGRPSPEEERLQVERQNFTRQTQERDRQDQQRFHQTFLGESKKLQTAVIAAHPAIQRLETVKALTPQKRAEIVEKVRQNMEKFLARSPSFMRKLRPAHSAKNLAETISLQKAAWSQPWLLNRMVRDVLRVETPALVQGNREAAARRAGRPAAPPAKPGAVAAKKPTGPRQIAGQWYKADGTKFTTAEIMAGKHLA